MTETAYGNGDKKFFMYNNLGQLRSVKPQEYSADNSKPIVTLYSYIYNSSGALQYISDKKKDIRTIVDYDSLGRLSKTELADDNTLEFIGSTEYDYDRRNNISKLITNYGGVSHTKKYIH